MKVEANGKTFEFPEGTSQEDIGTAVDEYFAKQQAPQPKKSDSVVGGFLDDIGVGAARGSVVGNVAAAGRGMDETISGVKQSGMEKLEALGLMDEGTAKAFTEMKDEEYAVFDKAFKEEFGDSFGSTTSKIASQVAPYMVWPGGQANVPTRLAMLAGGGALAGDTSYIPKGSGDRATNAIVGAGAGLAFGGLFEIVPAIKNFAKRWLSEGLDGEFAKEGAKLAQRTGVDLKLSQLTGKAKTEMLETLARGSSKGEDVARLAERTETKQLKGYFDKILHRLKPDSKRFGKSIKESFDAVMGNKEKGTGLYGLRAKQANDDFNAAFTASKGARDIPLTKFNKTLNELIEEIESTAKLYPGSAAAKNLKQLESLRGKSSKLNAREIHNLIKQYGSASKGKGKIFADEFDAGTEKNIAKKLFGALKEDATASPQLTQAMKNYAKISDDIREVKDAALGKIFEVKGTVTPDKIEEAFIKMDDTSIRHAMQVLERVDPVVKRRLQSLYLQRRLKGAGAWGQADVPNFSPKSMLNLINSEKKSFLAVFDDPTTANQVLDGLRAAQRVMMFNTRTAGKEGAVGVKLAGVLASMDKTFIARLAAEMATPSSLQKLILDKNAVKALMTISKPGVSQKAAIPAAKLLAEKLGISETTLEDQE